MSRETKIPDWVCMEHSQAGYLDDDGCTCCAKEKERDRREAAKDARILALEGTIDQLNARIEDYRRELGL